MGTRLKSAVLVSAIILGASSVAIAQSFDLPWLDDLTMQLLIEENCVADYFVAAREEEIDGEKTYKARAKCEDGRYLDAVRKETEWGFTIGPCGAIAC